jgi:hypothetical protein
MKKRIGLSVCKNVAMASSYQYHVNGIVTTIFVVVKVILLVFSPPC